MKKLSFSAFFLAVLLPLLFILFYPSAALGLTSCTYTKLGNPQGEPSYPPECQGGGGAQAVVALARKQLGDPYSWGAPNRDWAAAGDNPSSFDCSGLVGWSWYHASGGKVNLPGSTDATWGKVPSDKFQTFTPAQIGEILPGDVIYFTSGNVHHTGMYVGQGACGDKDCFIHAPKTGDVVKEADLSERNAGSDSMVGFIRPKL